MHGHSYNRALQAKAFVALGGFILSLSLLVASYMIGTAYADYAQARDKYQTVMETNQKQRQASIQPRPDNFPEITPSENTGAPTTPSDGLDPTFSCDYYSLCDLAEAFSGKNRLTTSILKSCLDFGLPADDNESVLNCFIGYGHTDLQLLSLLISAGADPNGITGHNNRTTTPVVSGRTPYEMAITLRDPTLLRFLIESGSDANAALKHACLSTCPEMVGVILESEVDLENNDEFWIDGDEGYSSIALTPLQTACFNATLMPDYGLNSPKVVSLLLQAGADPRNDAGIGAEYAPLIIAQRQCEDPETNGLDLVAAREVVKLLEDAIRSR